MLFLSSKLFFHSPYLKANSKQKKSVFFSLTFPVLLSLSMLSGCGGSDGGDKVTPDTIAPVITLNGEAIIDHNYGDVYTDLGASATDNVDGSVTVVTSGSVTVDMINSYTITYSATDSSNNSSSIERTVNVVDIAGPVITLNGLSTVTLGKGRVYKELGATAFDNFDGEILVSVPSGAVDYDNLGLYELTYSATDSAGNISTIIRTVEVIAPKPFITTWKTDNVGVSADNEITITTNPVFAAQYDYHVDWGDGTTDEHLTGDYTHTYNTAGTYTVTISGSFPQLYFEETSAYYYDERGDVDAGKLLSVEQWGDGALLSLHKAFNYCRNFEINSSDTPNLRLVADMSYMFSRAEAFNGDISAWDVSSVTDMSYMFNGANNFNQVISAWDVSSVTNMSGMFRGADNFNQDISAWDVSLVTDMSEMFGWTKAFNQNISDWDVSSVTNMSDMFRSAYVFNQDINDWDVSSVADMSNMFSWADSFNQDISAWDVSSVTNMAHMFSRAEAFDQGISAWDVSSVRNMKEMFYSAKAFNQDISAWDVSAVTDMSFMFYDADRFNGDINTWDVSSVTNMSSMFFSSNFNQNISAWDVSSVTDMQRMFGSSRFNQDISAWDVSSVTNMSLMFGSNFYNNGTSFNQDIGAWDVSSVTDMSAMFYASNFNQDISAWDVSSVTDMQRMFGFTVFNQNISAWDVSSVTNMSGMFGFSNFNQYISAWDVSSVTNMSWMFESYYGTTQGLPTQQLFFQDISAWDVSSVTNMTGMFYDHHVRNYDALLNAWSNLQLNSDVNFDAGYSQYSPSSQAARDILTNTYDWEVSDGGVTP